MSFPQQGWAAPGGRLAPEPPAKRPRMEPPAGAGTVAIGEVRFADVAATQAALQLHGSALEGHAISVEADMKSKDGTKIIVRNLPDGIDWSRLKSHFEQCGLVKFTDVKRTGSTPITGVVRFSTPEQAQAALDLNGTVVDGHEVAIKVHGGSKDRTKLQLFNLPPHMQWQELKDFFTQNGIPPLFCDAMSSECITAEVRFVEAQGAQLAVSSLNGGILGGAQISVAIDQMSTDGTRIVVSNIPAGIEWQELKDHFSQCGAVAFARTSADMSPKGKGVGKGKGGKAPGGCFAAPGGCDPLQQQIQALQMQMMELQRQAAAQAGGFVPAMGGGGFGGGFGGGKGKGGKGAGGKGPGFKGAGAKGVAGPKGQGEVRFTSAQEAQVAIATLNGSEFKGSTLNMGIDLTSPDGTRVWVVGVPMGTGWQELKEYFSFAGPVAYANVK